jgi:hypothetical protein
MPIGADITPLINAGVWHVGEISFIMLAGFLAWLNFQFAERLYFRRSNPAIVYRTDVADDDDDRFDPVTATVFGSAAFGLISGWCFVAGLSEVFRALRAATS